MTTMPLILVAVMVVLYACGVYLMLDRTLTRVLLGFLLVGNATNLLIFLMSGGFGAAPISGETSAEQMSDPLPQAFILTAIVITFGVSAFLLALIYRSWRLAHDRDDTVRDDEADVELATTEALTTVEVTDEDIEETPETSSDDSDDPDDSDDRDDPDDSDSSERAENTRGSAAPDAEETTR
ncbi:Na(+)/H(+) antiporter subunit C [Leucobacter ruminantium]|uniref:Na(+)/H(+) antiporter subunit C n=1 Tax=Leucobacter ruminantium TaxID=1289170 RepID=A0A939RYW3_9MICO|nr:Na(+)/H(+) antiporter subunit C [Leucobacter ruminantium]MBO1805266.1 Na(+)/H(+) antiporter subunit C [Leucobacter ruminantium]